MNTFQTGCVDNTQKCHYLPYKTDTELAEEEGGKLTCNPGDLQQCCTRHTPNANNTIPSTDTSNYKKVKTVEQDGMIKEMKICGCKSDDKTCLDKNCNGFNDITNFESCKIKSTNAQNLISSSPGRVVTIKDNDLYPDCYDSECQTSVGNYGYLIGLGSALCCCLIIVIVIILIISRFI